MVLVAMSETMEAHADAIYKKHNSGGVKLPELAMGRHGRRAHNRLTILRIADLSRRELAFPQLWPARPSAADYRAGWRKPPRLTLSCHLVAVSHIVM
jgi:hypothetical protein